MSSRLRTIGWTYGSSLLAVATTLISNFWFLRQVVKSVESEVFGAYSYVSSFSAIAAVLLVGVDTAAMLKISKSIGSGQIETIRRTVWQVRMMCQSIAACGLVFSVLSYFVIPAFVTADSAIPWASLIATTSATISIGFLARSEAALLGGFEMLTTVNLTRVAMQLATLVLGYSLFVTGWGILSLPIADGIAAAISWFVLRAFTMYHRLGVDGEIGSRLTGMSELVKHGFYLSMASFGSILEYTSDSAIVERIFPNGLAMVAIYAIWLRFPSFAFSTCLSFSGSTLPSVTTAYSEHSPSAGSLIRKLAQIELSLSTVAAIGLSMWLPNVIRLWVGPEYSQGNEVLLAIASGAWVATRSRFTLLHFLLNAIGELRINIGLLWLSAFIKIPLAIGFVYAWGIAGVFFASVATFLALIILMTMRLHSYGILPKSEITKSLIPLFATTVGGYLGFLIGPIGFWQVVAGIVLTAFISSIVILISTWRLKARVT